MESGRRIADKRVLLAWVALVVLALLAWIWPSVLAPSLLLVVPLAAATFAPVRAVAWLSAGTLLPAAWIMWTTSPDPTAVRLTRMLTWSAVLVGAVLLAQARRRADTASRYAAALDPLTGLPNRRQLQDHLHYSLQGRGSTAVLALDLDAFKAVNDRLGHSIGDDVLVAMAERIQDCVRAGDFVSRVGGDEFVVVCTAVIDLDEVSAICARIVDELGRPVATDGGSVQLSATVGGLVLPAGSGRTARSAVREADLLLVGQKATSKGTYRVHTDA